MRTLRIALLVIFSLALLGSITKINDFSSSVTTIILMVVVYLLAKGLLQKESEENNKPKDIMTQSRQIERSINGANQYYSKSATRSAFRNTNKIINFDEMPREFVIMDIETTGLDPYSDRIIEIGIIKVKDGEIIDQYNTLINPEMDIPITATRINNITNHMVKNKPKIYDVIDKIYNMLNVQTIVGYNVRFDLSFLDVALGRSNLTIDSPKILDVLDLVRQTISKDQIQNRKLTTLKDYFNIDSDSHRAIDDCITTLEVMKRCFGIIETNRESTLSKLNENELYFMSILEKQLAANGYRGKLDVRYLSNRTINFSIDGIQIGRVKLNGRKYKMQIIDKNNVVWLDIDDVDEAISNIKHWINYSKYLLSS